MTETLSLGSISTKLERIAELAKKQPVRVFTSVHHGIDMEWLREATHRVRKDAAVGVDGQSWTDYEANLEGNLQGLLERFKEGTYVAPPVRRVHIPKGDGRTRPIGIPTLEDKILEYGGGTIIDADIADFFGRLDHGQLRGFLDQRVTDGVLRKVIHKWLKAGVMEGGAVTYPEAATPQGGVISPLLANIYLHEVLDKWFEQDVRPRLQGRAQLVRYADDFVLVFEREDDARRVMAVLPKRFGKYGLKLHPEKTRLVEFKRPSQPPGQRRGSRGSEPAPETFEFLGFTHLWGVTRKNRWYVQRKTAPKRLTRALDRIRQWCQQHRHDDVADQHRELTSKLRGHYGYYGITGNTSALTRFAHEVLRIWRKWLDRRSQRASMGWERFNRLLARYPLPQPRVVRTV
jgi:group II intron reverse transcriptase/maturase